MQQGRQAQRMRRCRLWTARAEPFTPNPTLVTCPQAMDNFFYVPRYRGATLVQPIKYKYGGVLVRPPVRSREAPPALVNMHWVCSGAAAGWQQEGAARRCKGLLLCVLVWVVTVQPIRYKYGDVLVRPPVDNREAPPALGNRALGMSCAGCVIC